MSLDLDYQDELDKKIVRTQKGTKTHFGFFAGIHNWLRRRSRWYHNWHSKDHSKLIHSIVLAVYIFGYALIGLLVGLHLLSQYLGASAVGHYHETFTDTQYGEDFLDIYADGSAGTSGLWDSKEGLLRLRDKGKDEQNSSFGDNVLAWDPKMGIDPDTYGGLYPNGVAYVAWSSDFAGIEDVDVYMQKIDIATGDVLWDDAVEVSKVMGITHDPHGEWVVDVDFVESNGKKLIFVAFYDSDDEEMILQIIRDNGATASFYVRRTITQNYVAGGVTFDTHKYFDAEIETYNDNISRYHFVHQRYDITNLNSKIFYGRYCATDGGCNSETGYAAGKNGGFGTSILINDIWMASGDHSNESLAKLDGDPFLKLDGNGVIYLTYSRKATDFPPPFDEWRSVFARKFNWTTATDQWSCWWGDCVKYAGHIVDDYFGAGNSETNKSPRSIDIDEYDIPYIFWVESNSNKIYGQKIVGDPWVGNWQGWTDARTDGNETLIHNSGIGEGSTYMFGIKGIADISIKSVAMPNSDPYIYVMRTTNQNGTGGEPQEDIYRTRINAYSGSPTNPFDPTNSLDDDEVVGEGGETENIQVRSGSLAAIAAQTVGAGDIYMGFMLGFEHKDGMRWIWGDDPGDWYAEVRTDIFDVATPGQLPDRGTYPNGHEFVSFIGYETDTGSDLNGTYWNSSGTDPPLDVSGIDQYVTSENINVDAVQGADPNQNVWKIVFDPTDNTPPGTSLEYYVSTNGTIWQQVDSFAPNELTLGEELNKITPGNTLYWQVHLSTNDPGNRDSTPEVTVLDIDFHLDGTPPTSSVDAIVDQCYNAGEVPIPLTVTASDGGADDVSGVDKVELWYKHNAGDWTKCIAGVCDKNYDDTAPYEFNFNPAAAGGDGTYYFYSIATDVAGNKESAPGGNGDTSTFVDLTQPSVSSTVPQEGDQQVGLTQPITINFRETGSGMDTASVTASFSPAVGITEYSWNGSSLTLNHNDFIGNTDYQLRVHDGVADNCGNLMEDQTGDPGDGFVFILNFRTSNEPNLTPQKLITDSDETEVAFSESNYNEVLYYTIRITNTGGEDLSDINIQDQVPGELTCEEAHCNASHGGQLAGDLLIWSGLSLGVGEQVDVTWEARITALYGEGNNPFTNTAVVGYIYDPGPPPQLAIKETTAETFIIHTADIEATYAVTDNDETVEANGSHSTEGDETFTYTLGLVNTGSLSSNTWIDIDLKQLVGEFGGTFNCDAVDGEMPLFDQCQDRANLSNFESSWTKLSSGSRKDLNDIFGNDPNNIWAVGDNGDIVQNTQGSWIFEDTGLGIPSNLLGVWVDNFTNDPYVVSNEGELLVKLVEMEGQWMPDMIDPGVQLNAIAGFNGGGPIGYIYIAGDNGIIYSGLMGMLNLSVASLSPINGVDTVDASMGFAVSEAGEFLVSPDAGANWLVVDTAPVPLNDVDAVSNDEIYMVGDSGFFCSSVGGSFDCSQIAGLELIDLLGIHIDVTGRIYVSGEAGSLYYSDDGGGTWDPAGNDFVNPLNDVWSFNNSAYVVGDVTQESGNFGFIYDDVEQTLSWGGEIEALSDITIAFTYFAPEAVVEGTYRNLAQIYGSYAELYLDTNAAPPPPPEAPDMNSSAGCPEVGDSVTLGFDRETNEYAINSGNIDSVLILRDDFNPAETHTWGNISANWTNPQTLVIDFTTVGTIEVNDSIWIVSGTVQDPTDTTDAIGSPPAVPGDTCEEDPYSYRFKFMTAPTSTLIDTYSDMIIVSVVDQDDNEIGTGPFSLPVEFNSASSTGTFKDLSGSTGGNGFTITIPGNADPARAYFYYKDSTPGTFALTASENSSNYDITSGSQDITITSTPIVYERQLVFTTDPQELEVDKISQVMRVQLQDESGEGVNVTSNTTIALTTTSTGGKLYNDADGNNEISQVTMQAGTSTVSFYYSDSLEGYATVYAAESPSQGWADASQAVKIGKVPGDGDDDEDEEEDEDEEDRGGPGILGPAGNFFQKALEYFKSIFRDATTAIVFLALGLALLNYLLYFRLLNFLIYLLYIINYILEALSSKKHRKAWGQIYDAVTKQPLGLAIVRLFEIKDGKKVLMQTKVTDREGRFGFSADPGKYTIEVSKQQYLFPSKLVPKGFLKDDTYVDLYHGKEIDIKPKDFTKEGYLKLNLNIPIDPEAEGAMRGRVMAENYIYGVWLNLWYWVRIALNKIVIPLLLVSLAASGYSFFANGYLIDLIFLVVTSLLLIREFYSLIGRPTYGIVYDSKTKAPIVNALVQIFDQRRGKVRFRALTSGDSGRFFFLVPKGKYIIRVTKPGYTSPSKRIKTKNDLPYHNVYNGGVVEQKVTGSLITNIPMDPLDI